MRFGVLDRLIKRIPCISAELYQNPILTEEGHNQALGQGENLSTNLSGIPVEEIGIMCSPLNRCIMTCFLELCPTVKERYPENGWNKAIDEGMRILINPYLREAQDNGNQDSFGPLTIKSLKKQLKLSIKKCIEFLGANRPNDYDGSFFPDDNRFDFSSDDVLSLFDLEYMYSQYINRYVESLKTNNEEETFNEFQDKLTNDREACYACFEEVKWRWDNRDCRPKGFKKFNFKWRENSTKEGSRVLLQELHKSFKKAADLSNKGKKAIVLVSHGQKIMLAGERMTNLKEAREVKNAEILPLTMKFTGQDRDINIKYPLQMDEETLAECKRNKELKKGTEPDWKNLKDPWDATIAPTELYHV